jgi:hypothetical protein
MVYTPKIDKEINEADFYYINGIGYGGMIKYDFNNYRIINEDFYPQSWFYFINVPKVDYLNNKQYIDETYNQVQSISNYNGKVWEYIDGWSCEDFLKQCILRNNLTKFHLIDEEEYTTLIEIIKAGTVCDPSYKNIMVGGVCHFQHSDQEIIKI